MTPKTSSVLDGSDAGSSIFTIPPGAPFLQTLAETLLSGRLVSSFDPNVNPFALADSVIYLPTRRAARAFGLELLEAANRKFRSDSLLLPTIRTLGDLDEDEILSGLDIDALSMLAKSPGGLKVVATAKRHVALARFVQTWINAMSPETHALFQEEEIVLPSSSGDALYLANELAHFMDQIESEEASWKDIKNVAGDEFSEWWQLTLSFLSIIMKAWPEHLSQLGLLNPSEFRNRIIDFRIKMLTDKPPEGAVIAAGSTGSVPATARLLAQIAKMPNGAIILPGFDKNISKSVVHRFEELETDTFDNASSSHPQYGLVRLLDQLKTKSKDVFEIGKVADPLKTRNDVINTVMLPAEDTVSWNENAQTLDEHFVEKAFESVAVIEASGEQQEALAIALVLRQSLELPGKTAALVTPDRKLARRVSAELERFDILIDDSAGSALSISKPGIFLRQTLRSIFLQDDPVSISTMLKSDYFKTLLSSENQIPIAELLELLLIRDAIQLPNLNQLKNEVQSKKRSLEKNLYLPHPLRAMDEEKWSSLEQFADAISTAIEPLTTLARVEEPISIDQLIKGIHHTLINLSGGNEAVDDEHLSVFGEDFGSAELLDLLKNYEQHSDQEFLFQPYEVVSVFDALLSGQRTRQTGRTHPRLHIYGTLEARLQKADLMVLGGLNEGTWPQSVGNDPYLNRPMRQALKLPLPERRIGLSAHDFCQFSGTPEVIYSRSLRADNAPSIASRWLQRLATFLGEPQFKQMVERGNTYLHLSDVMDDGGPVPVSQVRPQPKPPVASRPSQLSFTEIETWIRDPYAIYAKHILKLYALPPLVRDADAALKGTIYHEILARFVNQWKGAIDENAERVFAEVTTQCFDEAGLPPEISASWRPRFDEIGKQFLGWETNRRDKVKSSHCEIDAQARIGETGFVLRGRADRIDIGYDGRLCVIDYKTGNNPSNPQARNFSPQLTLEGALASRGEFEGISGGEIDELLYVRLKEGDAFRVDDITKTNNKAEKKSADELAEIAYNRLIDQIAAYQSPDQAYISQYVPVPKQSFKGDYDHLARINEWSIGTVDNEGDSE